ncbi:origin recognition complex subunit 4 [Nakaseomyces bracarensis]|uniref:origin recognition complex subunit 4 n=1 Tax=Nakaseomyces bracarensis TaxID=273131 RepID=UPI003870F6AF
MKMDDQQNEVVKAEIKTVKLLPIKVDENLEDDAIELGKVLKKRRIAAPQKNDEYIDKDFNELKRYILRQLQFSLPVEDNFVLPYLQETEQEIDRITKQAVVQKESHSAIIVGQREGFKTYLLEHVISKITRDFKDQFITIRLNGLIHSELTAINSIAIQLEQQLNSLQQDNNSDSSNDLESAIVEDISNGSLTEVFEKILHLLDVASTSKDIGGESNKADSSKVTVLFIFDEIDAFAGPVRQTLLYNLFDMVEHARVPVCIFGCTTKLNILEFLEKRVRSRFSQRIIYMPQIASREQFIENVRHLLLIPEGKIKYAKFWNEKVNLLLNDQNSELIKIIATNDENFRSISLLRNTILPIIANSKDIEGLQDSIVSCSCAHMYNKNQLESSLSRRTLSLSDLELAILISSCRVALKTRDETCNFNLTYAEYESIVKTLNAKIPTMTPSPSKSKQNTVTFDSAIKLWPKKDIKNVWESLLSLGFLAEKSDVGLRDSAMAVFYASNYQLQGNTLPYDLRVYQIQLTLHELRRTIPRTSMYFQWTQL